VNYLLAILAAGLLGTGFVLQQAVAEHAPKVDFLRPRLLLDLLRHRRWLAGVATMVAGQLLSAWVIGHVTLSVAEPLLTANLLFALLLAWPLSKQPLTRAEIAGALILVAGVTALSLTRTVR
jgi:drug/metabolite transporter (DMT)-like permease